jgi:hypothetical protein
MSLALPLLLAMLALPVDAGASEGFWLGDAGPLAGPAPHAFHLLASVETDDQMWGGICLIVRWGDGESSISCDYCYNDGRYFDCVARLDKQHVYRCPGTYQAIAYSEEVPGDSLRFTVMVSDPEQPVVQLDPVYANDGRTCKLALVGELPLEYETGATIDWGDGSPVTPFTWRDDQYGRETPYHDYAQDGDYVARVVCTFECAYGPLTIETAVRIPGYTTPVQTKTWGGIKALYR